MEHKPQKITDYFGCHVFNDDAMKATLPEEIYQSFKKCVEEGRGLDPAIADPMARAMKDWAIEQGATHFTHWFQPMTGITAEKHDSFIVPESDGRVILEFSGKELIKGEADGSSFPSGGLRATFEARGYTAWDPSSYAFVKDGSLCIPTAFCSYGGESLDKKTPLLRSMQAIREASLRLIRLFGLSDVSGIFPTVGAEQEYFLIDKSLFDQRDDLRFCGRTLFGAAPPKGQEMSDHYYGVIKPRVSEFMKELDRELWKLGVPAKTKHNEAAPAQHEMAPVFTTVNIATDHNQLTMEILKRVAARHGLVCLLHEKPFAGVNGSGKHNNWSLSTDTGKNLLNPGKQPENNLLFLAILAAVIRAVDLHQDLLRISVASAENDHRLGASEAPPAIVSMYLGEELTGILDAMEQGVPYQKKESGIMDTGAQILPNFKKDNSDRNRTSPFAFTGNKFEFRMPGSSASIACTNVIINTIVAESFDFLCDRLENAEDFQTQTRELIREIYHRHKRIIFNGDGYSLSWAKEAERRGLLNYRDSVTAFSHYIDPKNEELFARYRIYSKTELRSRTAILIDHYSKSLHIEGMTAIQMIREQILPAISNYAARLSRNAYEKTRLSPEINTLYERKTAEQLSDISAELYENARKLEHAVETADHIGDLIEQAQLYRDAVLSGMDAARVLVDRAEKIIDKEFWPFPTYSDLLFSI